MCWYLFWLDLFAFFVFIYYKVGSLMAAIGWFLFWIFLFAVVLSLFIIAGLDDGALNEYMGQP